jgi:ferredoxin-like protein FixX
LKNNLVAEAPQGGSLREQFDNPVSLPSATAILQWPAAKICPASASAYSDQGLRRTATLDLNRCIFCGLCAEVDGAFLA